MGGRPRLCGAVALSVLAGCGAVVVVMPPRPESLHARSNWVLAGTLPPRDAFPDDWDYAVTGPLGWATPPDSTAAPAPSEAVFTPAGCGNLPLLLTGPGTRGASVGVERNTDPMPRARYAGMPDAAATGEVDDPNPSAHFTLWAVTDGPALIRDYLGWLDGCGSYGVVAADMSHRGAHRRAVTTEVHSREAGALVLTRSFVPAAGGDAITHHVGYYVVRGLLLECSTTMAGDAADLVLRQAAQTVRKLQAL